MNYDTTKRKIFETTQGENNNEIEGNKLKKLNLNVKPVSVTKTAKKIALIHNYNFTFGIVDPEHPFDARVNVIQGGPTSGGGGIGG